MSETESGGIVAMLRDDAVALDSDEAVLSERIEDAERKIVALRKQRDEVRFRRAELRATADFLDRNGWRVDRDTAGQVTVHVASSQLA